MWNLRRHRAGTKRSAARRTGAVSMTSFAGELLDFADHTSVQETFADRGWTDGLPIVPPTPDRVSEMLAAVGMQPDTLIGRFIEGNLTVDAEAIAVNAVMAGARPEYM